VNILPRRKEIELSVLLNGHVRPGGRHSAHGEMCFTCGTTSVVTVMANDTWLCGGGVRCFRMYDSDPFSKLIRAAAAHFRVSLGADLHLVVDGNIHHRPSK
jgi:hypothetical protein